MKTILSISFFLWGISALGQGGYDPALAYNKYQVAVNNRSFMQIGRYKVIGTPYLLGMNHTGNVFAKNETAGLTMAVAYNTYNQNLEFKPFHNSEEVRVKEPGMVDSFLLSKDSLIESDMFFVYGGLIGAKDKQYYQQLHKGDKYSLYKKYKSEMEVVSTNYVESELRQFELTIEYYYTKSTTKELKKLKVNEYSLKKEFSFVKNIDAYANQDRLFTEPEKVLKELFVAINATNPL